MAFLSSLTNLAKGFNQYHTDAAKRLVGALIPPKNPGPMTTEEANKQFSISRPQNLQTQGFQINSPVANTQGQALNKAYGPTKPTVPTSTIQQVRAPQIQQSFGQVNTKSTTPLTPSIANPAQIDALNRMTMNNLNVSTPASGLSGFTSYDPTVQNRLAEMQAQVLANSSQAAPSAASATTDVPLSASPTTMPAQTGLSDLEKAYLASFDKTQAETEAQQRLNDIIAQQANLAASEQLGLNKIKDQPIASPFITGQSASLQRSVGGQMSALEAQSTPLVNQLAAAQQLRQAQADRVKAEMEITGARESAMQPTTMEIGGALVQYNPATGQYTEVYRSPSEQAKPITLSEGQILVDPTTGKQIATGLPKPTSESGAPTIKSINGQDYQWNNASQQWESVNLPAGSGNLSPTMQYAVDRADNTMKFIDEALGMANWTTTGLVGAISKWIPGTKATDLKGVIDTIAGNIGFAELTAMRAASPTGGALGQVSDREIGLLTSVIGSLRQSQSTDQLKNNMIQMQQHLTNWKDSVEINNRYGNDNYSAQILNSVANARKSNPQLAKYSASEIAQALGFKTASGQALNSPVNSLNVPAENKKVQTAMGPAIITGYGSKYWKPGLDIVLEGSKTAPVKPPSDYTVVDIKTGYNSGFGNQVKVRDAQGNEMWFSHLDVIGGVQKGGTYRAGTPVGIQGNTGKTYGATGIHVDITMPKPGGGYYDARQVAAYLNAR